MTPVEPLKKAIGMNTADSTVRDADQRTGDLVHRLARGLPRREPFLAMRRSTFSTTTIASSTSRPIASTMREHGQHVDRIAGHGEHAEGAEQHHRHRDGRNQRRADVLQEQKHDEEHQHDGLDQRLDDLVDRHAHERRRVVGIDDLAARREAGLQLVDQSP